MTFTNLIHPRFSIMAVGAALATLTVAGCSSGDASAPATVSQSQSAPADVANPQASAQATPSEVGQAEGSDAAEFGLTEAEVTKRVDAIEQLIAQCMSAAGFEYVPVDYATVRTAMDTNSKPSGMTADEFRNQFGYGISTLSAGGNAQATVGLGRNADIRDGLPTADRVAWIRQLFGESPDQTFVVGLDSEDLSRIGGCTRTAVEATFTQAELGPGFVNYQNGESDRVASDPRIIDAYRNWSTCISDAGYGYGDSKEIQVDLETRLATLTGGSDIASLPADQASALKQLQGEELAIAAADLQCQIDNVDAIQKQVEIEILGRPAN